MHLIFVVVEMTSSRKSMSCNFNHNDDMISLPPCIGRLNQGLLHGVQKRPFISTHIYLTLFHYFSIIYTCVYFRNYGVITNSLLMLKIYIARTRRINDLLCLENQVIPIVSNTVEMRFIFNVVYKYKIVEIGREKEN